MTPYEVEAHEARVGMLLDLKRYDEAEKVLRKHLVGNPQDALSHSRLAYCMSMRVSDKSLKGEQRRYLEETMLGEAEAAVALEPNDGFSHYMLSHCLETLGKFVPALSVIARAIELEPEYSWVHYQQGYLFYRLGRYAEARGALLQALQCDPDHHDCLRMLAWVEYESGDKVEARKYADRALAREPENSDMLTIKGYSLINLHPPEAIYPIFLEAVRIDPHNDLARQGLARVQPWRGFLSQFGRDFNRSFSRASKWSRLLLISNMLILGTLGVLGMKKILPIGDMVSMCLLVGMFSHLILLLISLLVKPHQQEISDPHRLRRLDVFLLPILANVFVLWLLSLVCFTVTDGLWFLHYVFFMTPLLLLSLSASLVIRSVPVHVFSFLFFLLALVTTFAGIFYREYLIFASFPLLCVYIITAEIIHRRFAYRALQQRQSEFY